MRYTSVLNSRRWATALLAAGLSLSAVAQTAPNTGLGQSWQAAPDVSLSPHWHVYVFVRDGIRYLQVNDLNGTVHAAFAVSSGQFLVLPVGADAQNLSTAAHPSAASTTTETVYSDSTMQVTTTPQSNGSTVVNINSNKCDDPEQCSAHIRRSRSKDFAGLQGVLISDA